MPGTKASTSTWMVALLRGVNVGGQRVPMADLKALVESCGYHDVRTLLNSGNVVFRASRTTTATAASRIRAALVKQLDVDTPVMVRTRDELVRVLEHNPLREECAAHPTKFLVSIFDGPISAEHAARIAGTPFTVERAAVGEHAAYFSLPDGISASKPFELLGRQLGTGVTSRNWNTMTKLLAIMTDA